jgi:hypothetical protein
MAKPPPKKKAMKSAKPMAKSKPIAKMKPKAKIPSLGGGLMGLGGTGSQGMMP